MPEFPGDHNLVNMIFGYYYFLVFVIWVQNLVWIFAERVW